MLTTSISTENMSATSVMPMGAGHAPTCNDCTPSASTRTSSTIDSASTTANEMSAMARCTLRWRYAIVANAAPSSGTKIGAVSNQFTATTSTNVRPRPRRDGRCGDPRRG